MSKALLLEDSKSDYIDGRVQVFAEALQAGPEENIYALVENPGNNAAMADWSGEEIIKAGAEIIAFGEDHHILLVLIVTVSGVKKYITAEIPLSAFIEMESYLSLDPFPGVEDLSVVKAETIRLGF